MKLDFSYVPLIDAHAHPFCKTREPKDFAMFASSGYCPGPDQERYARSKMHYVLMIDHLRRYYGLPEDTPDAEVEAERYRRYGADPSGYYKAMLADANIGVLCNEIGTPHGLPVFTPEENAYYRTLVPEDQFCEIVRIERVFEGLAQEKLPFPEYVQQFHQRVDEQIRLHHAVGLKTLVAYFTGLSVRDITDAEARPSYERYILDGCDDPAAKKDVHDHLVCMGLEACMRNGLSMQIHVGFGPSAFCLLDDMDPLGLVGLITSPRFLNKVPILLLHACDPFIKQASYLTSQFSNVFCDFSSVGFISVDCYSMVRTLMERAPVEKLLYGSDCVCFPETAWLAAKHGRAQVTRLLQDLVEEDLLTPARARRFGEMMLCENALRLYPTLAQRPRIQTYLQQKR